MRFLFVAPHPDDLEFNIPSIMFSIAHCMKSSEYTANSDIKRALDISKSYFTTKKKDEFLFKAASMTRGEMASLTDEVQSTLKAAEIRSQELINGQNILTNKEPDFLGFFDGYVKVTEEAVQKLFDYIVKLQPDYIIGPEPTYVYYIHEDHVNTGRILYYAIKRMA
ncbi:MAG: PIG-L family deacetylase, partial [Promethearchaeota archaeon]